jgi:hypothetical protein
LTFANVSSVLTLREILISLNFIAIQNPISDTVAPDPNPYKDIRAFGFNLLKVHIKWFLGIRG